MSGGPRGSPLLAGALSPPTMTTSAPSLTAGEATTTPAVGLPSSMAAGDLLASALASNSATLGRSASASADLRPGQTVTAGPHPPASTPGTAGGAVPEAGTATGSTLTGVRGEPSLLKDADGRPSDLPGQHLDIDLIIKNATSNERARFPHVYGRGGTSNGPVQDTRVCLFVGNLPFRVRWQDVKDLFRRAGTVLRADVSLGADNRSRGHGTVLMGSREDGQRAVDMFNGYCWQTRILEVRPDRLPPEFEQHAPPPPASFAIGGGYNSAPPPQGFLQPGGHHSQPYPPLAHHSPALNAVQAISRTASPYGQQLHAMPSNGHPTAIGPASNAGSSIFPSSSSTIGGASPALIPASVSGGSSSNTYLTSPIPAASAPSSSSSSTTTGAVGPLRPYSSNASRGAGGGMTPKLGRASPAPPTQPSAPSHISRSASPFRSGAGITNGASSSGVRLDAPPGAMGSHPSAVLPSHFAGQVSQQQHFPHGAPQQPQKAPTRAGGGGLPTGGRVLFVGNLPFHIQWQDLKDLFRTAGNIIRADVTLGLDGRSKGYGNVLFATEEDAENGIAMFDGHELDGRILNVCQERYDLPRPSGYSNQQPHHGPFSGHMQKHTPPHPLLQQHQQHQQHQQQSHLHFLQQQQHPPAPPPVQPVSTSIYPLYGYEPPSPYHPPQASPFYPQPAPFHAPFQPPPKLQQQQQQAMPASVDSKVISSATESDKTETAASSGDNTVSSANATKPDESSSFSWAASATSLKGKMFAASATRASAAITTAPSGPVVPRPPPHLRQVHPHHPGPIALPPTTPYLTSINTGNGNGNGGGGPLSPLQTRGLPLMTPSMPSFQFAGFLPQTPPIYPHAFLSPGLGPMSPALGSPGGFPPFHLHHDQQQFQNQQQQQSQGGGGSHTGYNPAPGAPPLHVDNPMFPPSNANQQQQGGGGGYPQYSRLDTPGTAYFGGGERGSSFGERMDFAMSGQWGEGSGPTPGPRYHSHSQHHSDGSPEGGSGRSAERTPDAQGGGVGGRPKPQRAPSGYPFPTANTVDHLEAQIGGLQLEDDYTTTAHVEDSPTEMEQQREREREDESHGGRKSVGGDAGSGHHQAKTRTQERRRSSSGGAQG